MSRKPTPPTARKSQVTYCADCDSVQPYKLDEARRWVCRTCGFGVVCNGCGLPMHGRHNCERDNATANERGHV